MPVKLVVLYPKPTDVAEFERQYHAEHMPLMRRLVGPDVLLPTYRITKASDLEPPYYRMAEIPFAELAGLHAFVRSDASRTGHKSSVNVSTGGLPTLFVCESD